MINKPHRQLILIPSDINWLLEDMPALLTKLEHHGVLGQCVDTGEHDRYLIGDRFLQYFSFMGCSPAVEFEPVNEGNIDWQHFIFIHVPQTLPEIKWLVDYQTAKPTCPLCHKRTRDWPDALQQEQQVLQCPHCSAATPVCEWNWHDSGGCARQFICIVNVYPREAIPSDHFLKLLAEITGVEWRYFYVNLPLLPSSI